VIEVRVEKWPGGFSFRSGGTVSYYGPVLTEYAQAAMCAARYELMENGRYYGFIPNCEGVWGEAATLEHCREELRGALESWIIGGLRHGDGLPIIEGIDLNPRDLVNA
jgi:predicted RNase H-like HicB family nuclease